MARKWLLNCARKHDCRPSPRASFMPTRLLRLSMNGDDVEVKVVENLATKESYAALSYCWGGPQRITTTQANDIQHLTDIDLLALPQTIQDAVKVSLAIGISLLWVDALCIIQDCPNDRTLEIASMAAIYSHAAITITASRSTHADEGFLHPRSPPSNCEPDQLFRIKLRASNKSVGAVTLIPMHHFVDDEDVDVLDNEPLDHRAWAYQERHLSHRILDFGSYRTQFVCRHGVQHDHLPSDGWAPEPNTVDYRKTRPLQAPAQWDAHISNYTSRNMTIYTDRPLALSALAASLSQPTLGTYIAGLWTATLPTSLLWTTSHPRPRPMNYQGPSFSWHSINSTVVPRSTPPSFTPDPSLRILTHRSALAHPSAPFGAVTSAALTLRARLIPVKYTRDPS
ncbi:HET-domain-containing protein, partial [Pseudovirgaria hyperparasitica]